MARQTTKDETAKCTTSYLFFFSSTTSLQVCAFRIPSAFFFFLACHKIKQIRSSDLEARQYRRLKYEKQTTSSNMLPFPCPQSGNVLLNSSLHGRWSPSHACRCERAENKNANTNEARGRGMTTVVSAAALCGIANATSILPPLHVSAYKQANENITWSQDKVRRGPRLLGEALLPPLTHFSHFSLFCFWSLLAPPSLFTLQCGCYGEKATHSSLFARVY